MPVEGEDAESRLRELRGAYDRLRRRLDDTSASERDSARTAAAHVSALAKCIRQALASVSADEERERSVIAAWECDMRDGLACRLRSDHHAHRQPSCTHVPSLAGRASPSSDGETVDVRSEADYDELDATTASTASAARSSSNSTGPSNPNVLGEPVGGQSNRQWYLCEAVRRTLLLHASLAITEQHSDPTAESHDHNLSTSGTAAADDIDSDDAEGHRDDWRTGDITDAAVAALQRRNNATPERKPKKTSAFGALKASLSAKRVRRVEAVQEPKYHCHLDHGAVASEVGTERAGRLRPLRKDAITAALRERFGIEGDDDEEPTPATSGIPVAVGGHAATGGTAFGKNSFERIYGRTAAAATSSTPGADDLLFHGGRRTARVDEIVMTFHSEVHLTPIRRNLGLTIDDLRASCGSRCASWRVGCSAGKSDSMFLYFGHHVAKSVTESEFRFLTTEYLPSFAGYSDRAPYTLLPQFGFLFTVTWLASQRTMRFVVMNNVFRTQHFIQRMYDLKGSTVGRDGIDAKSGEATVRTGFGAVLLKDNDTPNRLMVLGPMRRAMLVAQIQSDTAFLQRLNVVDYSLLVGQRFRSISTADISAVGMPGPSTPPPTSPSTAGATHHRSVSVGDPSTTLHAAGTAAGAPTVGTPGACHRRSASAASGGHGPAGAAGDGGPGFNPMAPDQLDGRCFRSSDGGLVSLPVHESANGSAAREDTFYIGLIDVLQQYSGAKKIENMAKSIFYDGSKISIVPPAEFAQRLCMLVERVTV